MKRPVGVGEGGVPASSDSIFLKGWRWYLEMLPAPQAESFFDFCPPLPLPPLLCVAIGLAS